MKRALIAGLSASAVTAIFALGTLSAQQPMDHSQHMTPAKPAAAKPATTAKLAAPAVAAQDEEMPEIFCSTMKTGQLCSHGTADALRLTGAKADEWVVAARKYNKAVDAATKQLQADAKTLLSAQQAAELDRWFALGMNVEMNKMLVQTLQGKNVTAKK